MKNQNFVWWNWKLLRLLSDYNMSRRGSNIRFKNTADLSLTFNVVSEKIGIMMIKKLILNLIPVILISVCCSRKVGDFKNHYVRIETDEVKVVLYLFPAMSNTAIQPLNLLDPYLRDHKSKKEIYNACGVKISEEDTSNKNATILAGNAAPLASALGKFLFDQYMDNKSEDLKDLKGAAQQTYSQRIILSSEELKESKCAFLVRSKGDTPGFISVVKFIPHQSNLDKSTAKPETGFSFKVIYTKAFNTIAITKKTVDADYKAQINTSVAISIKAIGIDDFGLPRTLPVGEGVVTVKKIVLDPSGDAKEDKYCEKDCEESELIPYLKDGKIISVTMSVTETGNIGINFDKKLSEAKAIRDALGPAIKSTLENYLKEDE